MNREFLRYLAVGVVSFSIDSVLYWSFLTYGMEPAISKSISYVSGMISAFVLNKNYTFRRNETNGGKVKFFLVYLSSFSMNVIVNNAVITHFPSHIQGSKTVAFLAASAVAILINYFGMKKIVFKYS